MNDENCRDFLCKEKIHSSSDWKKAALRTKKALQNSGIAEFEAHPEYRKITDCKPDDDNYPSSEDCNRQVPRPATTGKRGRCPKGTTFNKRTQNCEPKNRRGSPVRQASPTRRASRPAKRGRCPKGTKRNKRTQNCEPKNRRGSPARAASPPRPAASAKRGRCPNGTRRNKRTQNCEQK